VRERPLVRLATFAAFGLYGTLRWSDLMDPAPTGRLLALLGVALVIVALGTALEGRPRWLVGLAGVLGVIAIFPLAGMPLDWVRHVRLSVGAGAISQGLSALPNALVPYLGINQWVRAVIMLGAGVLLLDAALLVAFWPRAAGDARRAAAALPLVALAIVPTTLVKPSVPYLHGLILFGLLAAFMWAERAPTRDGFTSVIVIAVAGIGGVIAAPALDQHSAWINYESLAQKLVVGHVDQFTWLQGYGPLRWPTHGQPVLDVKAHHPEYWKAEDLDVFDGFGWTTGSFGPQPPASAISATARREWTQTIQVTLRSMRTFNVIAAGDAAAPTRLAQGVIPGASPGTWTTGAELQPGDSYRISVYAPNPTPAQLAAAGTDYPRELIPGFLTFELPGFDYRGTYITPQDVLPAAFGSRSSITATSNSLPDTYIQHSPYAQAYSLAVRLAHGATTPYAYIEHVVAYLKANFFYDTVVAPAKYPLETFLFNTHTGYCQQFAGAAALLLRMAGIPSRVAVGFTTGNYDSATSRYVVDDIDAHAWVEAWFPGYGWVKFDPTVPSTQISGATAPNNRSGTGSGFTNPIQHKAPAATTGRTEANPTGTAAALWLAVPAVLLLIGLVLGAVSRRSAQAFTGPGEWLVAELERAMRRTGRPVADGITLSALEQRFARSPGASGYLRSVRLARYAGGRAGPTGEQRRALRRELAAEVGPAGRLRALWALPPRPLRRRQPED
jgi:protein-glutamine gamma-glutamyltransferase